jgi:uroporphyrinogen III methyltransferase/synthase
VASCDTYDWIIFTSANAVSAFGARPDLKARIATIGAATREAAEERGFTVALTPDKYVAESLIESFGPEELSGCRILIPSAAVTRDVIPQALRKGGAEVDIVEAYRNVLPSGAAVEAAAIFCEPYPDWVTFASSSAVHNLVHLIGTEPLQRVKIATIGPVTSDTVRQHGITVTAEAEVHTAEGLIDALVTVAKD